MREVYILKKVLELISKEVGDAFEAAGYDRGIWLRDMTAEYGCGT